MSILTGLKNSFRDFPPMKILFLIILMFVAEVMGALVSVLIIWVLTGILVYEAVMRVKNQDFELKPTIMIITSGVGVLVNIM